MSYININEIDSFIEVMGWTMDSNTQGFTSYWRNSLADAESEKGHSSVKMKIHSMT